MLGYEKPTVAFFEAIRNLRFRQVALILQTGFNPNLLINSHNQNGLQFMINYFSETDARLRLQIAVNKAAYINIAKLLLDSGLDANAIDLMTGETVLFDAIRFDDREMVVLLMSYANLSIRNKDGETALMVAARVANKSVMRILLDHMRQLNIEGYYLRQRNRFGQTALDIARSNNLEAAKVLTKHVINYGHPLAIAPPTWIDPYTTGLGQSTSRTPQISHRRAMPINQGPSGVMRQSRSDRRTAALVRGHSSSHLIGDPDPRFMTHSSDEQSDTDAPGVLGPLEPLKQSRSMHHLNRRAMDRSQPMMATTKVTQTSDDDEECEAREREMLLMMSRFRT